MLYLMVRAFRSCKGGQGRPGWEEAGKDWAGTLFIPPHTLSHCILKGGIALLRGEGEAPRARP